MKIDLSGETTTQPDREWTDEQKRIAFHLIRSFGWLEQVGTPVLEGRMVIDFAISQEDLLYYATSYQVYGRQQQ